MLELKFIQAAINQLLFFHYFLIQGIKLKVDEAGNILIKRLSRNDVYVKNCNQSASLPLSSTPASYSLSSSSSTSSDVGSSSESAVSNEIISVNGKLDQNKAYKLFDMRKFTSNLDKEISTGYPDRCKLETQCISVFSFVKDSSNILDLPCYILIVNIIALDILRSRLPLTSKREL